MSIIARFKDIMASNINALLDKAENPEKMIDQYLRNLKSDLGKVKAETASVMAEERRAKRALNERLEEIEKMERYAIRALEAENETDARRFLERKKELEGQLAELRTACETAETNARQMRQMHDKLVSDIKELESRASLLKAKWQVAKTQERANNLGAVDASGTLSAFSRMEDKINRKLDEANAMAELNVGPKDDIADLVAKYDNPKSDSSIDQELAALKERIGKKE